MFSKGEGVYITIEVSKDTVDFIKAELREGESVESRIAEIIEEYGFDDTEVVDVDEGAGEA